MTETLIKIKAGTLSSAELDAMHFDEQVFLEQHNKGNCGYDEDYDDYYGEEGCGFDGDYSDEIYYNRSKGASIADKAMDDYGIGSHRGI